MPDIMPIPCTGQAINVAFITADGGQLCVFCAIGCNGSRAPECFVSECPDDEQWQIIGIQDAEPGSRCDHCYGIYPLKEIPVK